MQIKIHWYDNNTMEHVRESNLTTGRRLGSPMMIKDYILDNAVRFANEHALVVVDGEKPFFITSEELEKERMTVVQVEFYDAQGEEIFQQTLRIEGKVTMKKIMERSSVVKPPFKPAKFAVIKREEKPNRLVNIK